MNPPNSYLNLLVRSKQQSDLVYINEKFQSAVKSAAAYAGTANFNGQVSTTSTPLQNKNVMNKMNKYYKSRPNAPIKEMDKLEQTSRSIMLAGTSKSDDEEESFRTLSPEEKRKLNHDINRLPQKMLGQLIEKIATSEGVDVADRSEFVIDYEKMKPMTLRKVAQFVAGCVKRLPRQKQIQGIPVTDPNHPNYSSLLIKQEQSIFIFENYKFKKISFKNKFTAMKPFNKNPFILIKSSIIACLSYKKYLKMFQRNPF